MHSFRAYISIFTELSNEDWDSIHSCLTYKIVQQNRILLKPDSICKNLYFLETGSIRYFASKYGEDETLNIIQPPFLFTSVQSFSQQIPSSFGIQAIDESYVWSISRDDAFKLLEIPSWSKFISTFSSGS